jgi:hypothetical protein
VLGATRSGLAQPAREPLIFAAIVGHNAGTGDLPTLRYADDDALRFFDLISQVAPRGQVELLVDPDLQTRQRLQRQGGSNPELR